jgi:ABC-type branched-subunit amino acid transport system substrate-binding protein
MKTYHAGKVTRRTVLRGASLASITLATPQILRSRPAMAQEKWPVGWVRPTTGPLASTFAELFVPSDIALAEINAADGVLGRQILRIEEDDQASPAAQPAIVRKLSEAGVNCIVGPVGTSQTLASLVASTQMKMIQAGYVASAVMGDAARYPYHYHLFMTIEMEAEAAVAYAVDRLGLKKVAILSESSGFGAEITQRSIEYLAKRGLEPSAVQEAPVTAPDVGGYLRNLRNSGAEAVLMWFASKPFAARVFSGMAAMNWIPEAVVGHGIVLDPVTMDNADPDLLPRITSPYFRNFTWKGDGAVPERQLKFAKDIAASGTPPTPNIAMAPWYDFLHLVQRAAEDAQSLDSDALKAALDSVRDYDGILGSISFTAQDHVGLSSDAFVMVTAESGRDERAMGIFRAQA